MRIHRIPTLKLPDGLSQADLARATGYHESTVSRWCNGVERPTREALIALLLAVPWSPDWKSTVALSFGYAPLDMQLAALDHTESALLGVRRFWSVEKGFQALVLRELEVRGGL